jgi:hypothetical protein
MIESTCPIQITTNDELLGFAATSVMGKRSEACFKSDDWMVKEVSTTCGSGWVDDQLCDITNDFEYVRVTHPLPQVVLTASKRN